MVRGLRGRIQLDCAIKLPFRRCPIPMMEQASCSFNVSAFSFCLQDETSPGNVVLVNASTGDYSFCCGGVQIASGRGTLTTRGCIGSIDASKGDRQVHIQWDTSANNGSGRHCIRSKAIEQDCLPDH